MSERDLLVSSLLSEVLGPRDGAREILKPDEDPLDEYITGVLAPYNTVSIEIDANDELVGEGETAADDQSDPDEGMAFASLDPNALPSPTLDPRARPASLGLSFCVKGDDPKIDVGCSWARYSRDSSGGWERIPAGAIWQAIDANRDQELPNPQDPDVRVTLRSRPVGSQWRVTIFLVNCTAVPAFPSTEHHLFQPQIRVSCGTGTVLVPLDATRPPRDSEEQVLQMLYRDHVSLGRGHLCSATWKEIDPEGPAPGITAPAVAPFSWLDGITLFGPTAAARFSPADVRTEYLPLVCVGAPDKRWPVANGPELDPSILAEKWDPAAIKSALAPLADGYDAWLQGQTALANALPASEAASASGNLARCSRMLARLQEGIQLVHDDEEVRLAFCFANHAIATQSRWTKKKVNPWWPFQLAFQLVNIAALADRHHADRETCDLLWFPTGGGKTEAYLGLAAFVMALRRIRAVRNGREGAGVTVLSRYTLRLLTIQQFRRALALVTACELMRVEARAGFRGWRPQSCPDRTDLLWGTTRFSIGLWVGGNVTPNNLQDFEYQNRRRERVVVNGAISILEGAPGQGEPAQVLTCPACDTTLAVGPDGLQPGEEATFHYVVGDASATALIPTALSGPTLLVKAVSVVKHGIGNYLTASIKVAATKAAGIDDIIGWYRDILKPAFGSGSWLVSASPVRPGYFVRVADWRGRQKAVDFEVICPNPQCPLCRDARWSEVTPTGNSPVRDAFRLPSGEQDRCPIPAYTVDEQLYQRCPSMVIATVDKFARLAFEPRAATMFGNVEHFNSHLGYYRSWCPSRGPSSGLPNHPLEHSTGGTTVPVSRLDPPELVLQDELHLIDGPLGSMVGLYETVVDALSARDDSGQTIHAKYIASTATVRNAEDQVSSLFLRRLAVFPPQAVRIDDSFFSRSKPCHPLASSGPGRLYVGICAPGRGAQTPIVRIWARLLQQMADRRNAGAPLADLDPLWTLVGYFNAIRELAGAVALTRQDIVQRLSSISANPRQVDESEPVELSSRADSLRLPSLLAQLQLDLTTGTPVNVVAATSMFGTGVDVDRLGLMVVHGQPKTASSYIQATGRVGRRDPGLVVTLFRASRPRDLNHFEYFSTFHQSLYKFVEPVTVNPFSPRARDRALGPVSVAILRQGAEVRSGGSAASPAGINGRWRVQQRVSGGIHSRAGEMAVHRLDGDVAAVPPLLESRSQAQPQGRRPGVLETLQHAGSELDRWQQLAARTGPALVYNEPTVVNPPSHPVVLGDLAHEVANTGVAFENAPNSLRDVEATVTVKGWR